MVDVSTPTRWHAIKQVCRRDYSTAINNLQKVVPPAESVVTPAKVMVDEIKQLCSKKENSSLFRDNVKALSDFKWDLLWFELASRAPTLLKFYQLLFNGAPKPLICFAVSMAVKWRSSRMSLVQSVISTVMYGNGASKEVSVDKLSIYTYCVIILNFCAVVQQLTAYYGLYVLHYHDSKCEITGIRI